MNKKKTRGTVRFFRCSIRKILVYLCCLSVFIFESFVRIPFLAEADDRFVLGDINILQEIRGANIEGVCSVEFLKRLDPSRRGSVEVMVCGVLFDVHLEGIRLSGAEVWSGMPQSGSGGLLIVREGPLLGGTVFIDTKVFWLDPGGNLEQVIQTPSTEPTHSDFQAMALLRPTPMGRFLDHGTDGCQGCTPEKTLPKEPECHLEKYGFQFLEEQPFVLDVLAVYSSDATLDLKKLYQECRGSKAIDFHAMLLEELTNWTFRLSDVGLAVSIKVSTVVPREIDRCEIFEDIDQPKGPPFEAIRSSLERNSMDLAVMIQKASDGGIIANLFNASCGQACPCRPFCVSREPTFVVNWKCAMIFFSFAHELGHLLGAAHAFNGDACKGSCAFSQACGLGSGAGSIMTGSVKDGTVVLPYWSSPERCADSDGDDVKMRDNALTIRVGGALLRLFREPSGGKSRMDLMKQAKELGLCPIAKDE